MKQYRILETKDKYGTRVRRVQQRWCGLFWITCWKRYAEGAFTGDIFYWCRGEENSLSWHLMECWLEEYRNRETLRLQNIGNNYKKVIS